MYCVTIKNEFFWLIRDKMSSFFKGYNDCSIVIIQKITGFREVYRVIQCNTTLLLTFIELEQKCLFAEKSLV